MARSKYLSICSTVLTLILILTAITSAYAGGAGIPTPSDPVGNTTFEALRTAFPGIWNPETGMTQAAISLDSGNMISEEVWIELPIEALATGQKDAAGLTGQRDLVAIRITRPRSAAESGVKVPVLLNHSPYRNNNNPNEEYVKQITRNHPNTEDERRDFEPYDINPDTSDYDYRNDVSNKRLALSEWPFDGAAHPEVGYYSIPASRGDRPVAAAKTSTSHQVSSGNLSFTNYMFARGFAYITSGFGGGRMSLTGSSAANGPFNDGLATYGETYEMLAGLAVIKWLNGECKGYTSKEAVNEVKADWATGETIMTGTSYDGTVQMGIASSGYAPLKAIIPIAGISNMYEYFRTNGTVYPWSQGEDVEWLSRGDTSRYQDPNFQPGQPDRVLFESIMSRINIESSHETGDYNEFWDMCNWTKDASKFKAAVLFTQGQQDRNVGTIHFDQLYRALKEINPDYPIKILLHLSGHTTMWNMGAPHWLEVANQWVDHFVYGIDNGIERDGKNVWVADNVTGGWNVYETWPISGSQMRRYYFGTAETGGGQLLPDTPPSVKERPFKDPLKYRVPADIENPGDRFFNTNPYTANNTGVMNNWYFLNEWMHDAWEAYLLFPITSTPITSLPFSGWGAFGQHPSPQHRSQMVNINIGDMTEIEKHTENRLVYLSEELTEAVTLSGTARVSVDITPDKSVGVVSAMILDLGEANRHFYTQTNPAYAISANGGINAYNRVEYAFRDYKTPYHEVTRSSVDIQNPNPSGITYLDTDVTRNTGFMPSYTYQTVKIQPGETYTYVFTLEPRNYTFREGHRIAIVLFTTDYKHTQMPFEATECVLTLGENSYVDLPLTAELPQPAGPLNVTTDKYQVRSGEDFTVGVSFRAPKVSNTAVIGLDFDAAKFHFSGFTPASGVTPLTQEVKDGKVFLTVMVNDYSTLDYGMFRFTAIEDVFLDNTDNTINVAVQYVVKDEEGIKTVETALGTTTIYTAKNPFEGVEVSLIHLSNIIDIFGYNTKTEGWLDLYRAYDFNNNGEIDIADIIYVAMLIKQ